MPRFTSQRNPLSLSHQERKVRDAEVDVSSPGQPTVSVGGVIPTDKVPQANRPWNQMQSTSYAPPTSGSTWDGHAERPTALPVTTGMAAPIQSNMRNTGSTHYFPNTNYGGVMNPCATGREVRMMDQPTIFSPSAANAYVTGMHPSSMRGAEGRVISFTPSANQQLCDGISGSVPTTISKWRHNPYNVAVTAYRSPSWHFLQLNDMAIPDDYTETLTTESLQSFVSVGGTTSPCATMPLPLSPQFIKSSYYHPNVGCLTPPYSVGTLAPTSSTYDASNVSFSSMSPHSSMSQSMPPNVVPFNIPYPRTFTNYSVQNPYNSSPQQNQTAAAPSATYAASLRAQYTFPPQGCGPTDPGCYSAPRTYDHFPRGEHDATARPGMNNTPHFANQDRGTAQGNSPYSSHLQGPCDPTIQSVSLDHRCNANQHIADADGAVHDVPYSAQHWNSVAAQSLPTTCTPKNSHLDVGRMPSERRFTKSLPSHCQLPCEAEEMYRDHAQQFGIPAVTERGPYFPAPLAHDNAYAQMKHWVTKANESHAIRAAAHEQASTSAEQTPAANKGIRGSPFHSSKQESFSESVNDEGKDVPSHDTSTESAGAPKTLCASGDQEGRPAEGSEDDTERICPMDRPKLLMHFTSPPPLFKDLCAESANYTYHSSCHFTPSTFALRCVSKRFMYVYVINHKCRRTPCVSSQYFAVGDIVVLEGDLGIDMGDVEVVMGRDEFALLSSDDREAYGFPTLDFALNSCSRIYRVATPSEVQHYSCLLPELEDDLLVFLRGGVNPDLFRDCDVRCMQFVQCEIQADLRKVYVYYRTSRKVLFRELAQYLFTFYRCRIWMHEVGRLSPTAKEALQTAPAYDARNKIAAAAFRRGNLSSHRPTDASNAVPQKRDDTETAGGTVDSKSGAKRRNEASGDSHPQKALVGSSSAADASNDGPAMDTSNCSR